MNDNYGHLVGDQILQLVARTLTLNARPFDLYGRWGGEEFLGIIRNISMADLQILCERLLRLIESSQLDYGEQSINVTASIGATLANPEDSLLSLTERADALLYQSKDNGRNCASVSHTAPEPQT